MNNLAIKNYAKRFFIFPLRNVFIRLSGLLGNYNSVVWLISDGRSGSTWVASILSNDRKALQVFEPFHPEVIGCIKGFEPYTYNEKIDELSKVVKFYRKVFAGELLHRRVNYDNRRLNYSGIIVKDVFASLTSHAIYEHFKKVSIVILIRNPFDVILSKNRTSQRGWLWPSDLTTFLNNSKLMEKLNNEQTALICKIQSTGTLNEKQMVNWTLSYFIMLSEFKVNERYLLFYEKIKKNPIEEFDNIKKYFGSNSVFFHSNYPTDIAVLPSRTLRTSASDKRLNGEVQKCFSSSEFETMSSLLRTFNLTRLYGKDGLDFLLD
jgi:hypothetical protein